MRALEGLVDRDPLLNRYYLTPKGKLASEIISDISFRLSIGTHSPEHESISYVQNLKFGDHAFLLYDNEKVRQEITHVYIKAKLANGEAVIYIISERKIDSEIQELRKYVMDIDHQQNGALTVLSAEEWYINKGKAQPKKIVENTLEFLKSKQKAGFTGIYGTGEMNVFFNHSKRELLEYEKLLGRKIDNNTCGLCTYDDKAVDHETLVQLTNYHGHIVSKDLAWRLL